VLNEEELLDYTMYAQQQVLEGGRVLCEALDRVLVEACSLDAMPMA
jgi:hypothetical protein